MLMLAFQYRDVAQVVERYFREVEAASSSLVIPIKNPMEVYIFPWGFCYLIIKYTV